MHSVAAGSKILILGDSMGQFSCGTAIAEAQETFGGTNVIEEFCTDSTVTNYAVGGSTAWQWRSGDLAACSVQRPRSQARAMMSHISG